VKIPHQFLCSAWLINRYTIQMVVSSDWLIYSQFRVIRGCHVKGTRVKIWCFSLREQGFNPQIHNAAT